MTDLSPAAAGEASGQLMNNVFQTCAIAALICGVYAAGFIRGFILAHKKYAPRTRK